MVKGPATVTVHGRCELLGRAVSGRTISVRSGKSLPFEPNRHCRLHVKAGRGGRKWWADASSAGTLMWRTVVRDVLSSLLTLHEPFVVMVAGGTDTGKSTFCAYLANRAIADGFVPSIVDGDIGQSDLAPPSVIGAATLGQQIADLREVSATTFEFVGSVSPHGLERFISQKLASIVTRSCSGVQLCIVNTDGYVDNGGVLYKKMIASEIQPNIIVLLGKDRILQDTLALGPWQLLHAKSSTQVQKSRTVRALRRQDQFARFVGCGQLSVEPSDIIFNYLGMAYSFPRLQAPTISQLEPENMRQMFVGLGSGGGIIGFGVVAGMTPETLAMMTDIRNFDTVYLSDIKLV